MPLSRRDLIRASLASAAALAAGSLLPRSASAGEPKRDATRDEPRKDGLRLLILGGTGFLGPQIVELARSKGHVVTLFNRGKTNPQLFPDVEKLRGDRDGNLEALKDRSWDAVVDTSGYTPRTVSASAGLLAPSVKQYVFISTLSVFGDTSRPGLDETSPVAQLPPGQEATEDVMTHYGALKAACERAAESALPGRVTKIRPALIVGPGDPTDRFTYWPVRASEGGAMLAPGDGNDPVQLVDVRDLAAFIVRVIERGHVGIYNAPGPSRKLQMRAFLDGILAGTASKATPEWVPAAFLEAQGVQPWSDLPAWVPLSDDTRGFATISNAKAVRDGLSFRPLSDTARDTLSWWKTLPEERRAKPRAGLPREREQAVLAAWRASRAPAGAAAGAAAAPGAR